MKKSKTLNKMKLFLTGNFKNPAQFDNEKKRLEIKGNEVINRYTCPFSEGQRVDLSSHVENITKIAESEGLYLDEDWRLSKNARLEKSIAEYLDKEIVYRDPLPAILADKAIIEIFDVTIEDVKSKKQFKNLLFPRILLANFLRNQGTVLRVIAEDFNKSRPIISYYISQFTIKYKKSKKFREVSDRFDKLIYDELHKKEL